jgi:hypothetical protein
MTKKKISQNHVGLFVPHGANSPIENELCNSNEFLMKKKRDKVDERSKDVVVGLFVPQSGLQGRWVEPEI